MSRIGTRQAIAVGALVLALLTVLGNMDVRAPAASVERMAVATEDVGAAEGGGPTLAEIFADSQGGAVELEGEAQDVVAVAPPAIPDAAVQVPEAQPSDPPALDLPPVRSVLPSLRVPDVTDPAVAAAIGAVEGVVTAAAAQVGEVVVQGGDGPRTVTVAAVDPQAFRPLTPQITADEPAVWERIIAGDAAFTHDIGNRLDVPLGASVPAGPADGQLRVGAYASNGIPPVADAIVSRETAAELGMVGGTDLYVAVEDGADVEAIRSAIAAVTGVTPEVLEEPQQQRAFLTGSAARDFFEPFSYIDHGDGLITIDPDWVQRNIVSADVPVFGGHVTCHRQFVEQLRGALQEIVDLGLDHLIDPSQYGGCWVARHIDWRPDRPLSMHAWGLAIDFNVSTNQLGATPTLDPRIVEVFDRWGFVWGGRWSRPDGMHFELGAVLQ